MARSALIAASLRQEDEAFYGAKITTAAFYFDQIMPRAQAHFSGVSLAATAMMELTMEQF